MSWRLAKALERLRYEINQDAPKRSKASDGTIGDQRHKAVKSEHNPNSLGVVTAMDVTDDPKDGCDAQTIVNALVASRDPRIYYLIWNSRIVSRTTSAWQWRRYSGANPHNKHFHISVTQSPTVYDDASDWAFNGREGGLKPVELPIETKLDTLPDVFEGAKGDVVFRLQKILINLGYYKAKYDGDFGPKTDAAVKSFQKEKGLRVDGWVGPKTWEALNVS